MEHDLAINQFSSAQLRRLEDTQNKCIRKIYGAHNRSSTKVILHLAKLPTMNERVRILQARFLFRSFHVPKDSLLGYSYMINTLEDISGPTSLKLPFGRVCLLLMTAQLSMTSAPSNVAIYSKVCNNECVVMDQSFLSFCRPELSIDPILWIPMTHRERSRCIRWRLGWLSSGRLRPCLIHRAHMLTRPHAIECLRMHHRLRLLLSIPDPLSFLVNKFPMIPHFSARHIDSWHFYRPIICSILSELDQLQHGCLSQ